MAEQDFEHPHELNGDEFDIEITDLDAVEGAEKGDWGEAAAEIERAGKSEEPVRGSRSGLRSRWTRRQHVLQVVVTTIIAPLLLSIFLNRSPSMRSVIIGLLRPTPTPQPPVESDSFYLCAGKSILGTAFH